MHCDCFCKNIPVSKLTGKVTAKDGGVEIKIIKKQILRPTAEDRERDRAYKKEKERNT